MANGQNIVIVTLTQWWLAAQPAAEGHSTSRKSTDGLWRWSGKVKCHHYRFPLSERNHLGINAECGGAFKSSYSRRVKTLMAATEDGSEKLDRSTACSMFITVMSFKQNFRSQFNKYLNKF